MNQTSAQDLLQNDILVISFQESAKENQYPPIQSKINLENSIFREEVQVRGIKKSSFNLEDSFNEEFHNSNRLSQSFSALNGSVREENIFQSKLKVNRGTIKEGGAFNQKDFWDLNKSIFTDKVGNSGFSFNRGSLDKEEEQPQNQQIHEPVPYEMQPSVENQQIQTKSVKKQIPPESEIKLILRSTNYFLQKPNGDSILVNSQMLRDLYDEFFNKQIFIPLFKYQRYDEWYNSKDKFNIDLEAHRIFKISLERYITYISLKYPKEFDQVFKILEEIQRGKVAKKREQSAFTFLNFDLASIVQNLKNFMSSPKTEILRKTLLAKIRSVRETIKMAEMKMELHQEAEIMKKQIEEEWKEFGEVELLLYFEETEYYCIKKIQNSPELKFREIWIKYRDFIRAEKAIHSQQSLRSIWI